MVLTGSLVLVVILILVVCANLAMTIVLWRTCPTRVDGTKDVARLLDEELPPECAQEQRPRLFTDDVLAAEEKLQRKTQLADQGLVCSYWLEEDERQAAEEDSIRIRDRDRVVLFSKE